MLNSVNLTKKDKKDIFNKIKKIIIVLIIIIVFCKESPISAMEISPLSIRAISWSPDGNHYIVGYQSGQIEMVNVITQQKQNLTSPSPQDASLAVAWSPLGDKIAGGYGTKIYVWNADGTVYSIFEEHLSVIVSLAWSDDGLFLSSVSFNTYPNNIVVHDVVSKQVVYTTGNSLGYKVAWSPNGQTMAVGGESFVGFYSQFTGTWQSINTIYLDDAISGLMYHPTNNSLIAASTFAGQIYLLDAGENWNILSTLNDSNDDSTPTLDWNKTENLLASGDNKGSINIWSASGELIRHLQTDEKIYAMEWSPDGSKLAYGGESGEVKFIEANALIPPDDRSVPIPIGPSGTITEGFPTYSWWAVPGADFYEVYVDEITNGTMPTELPFTIGGTWLDANQVCDGDICQVQYHYPEIVLNNFNYRWLVRSYDQETNTLTDWNAARMEFTINVPPPPVATPISVSPVVYMPTIRTVPYNYHQITVEWLPTPYTTHYRFYFGVKDATGIYRPFIIWPMGEAEGYTPYFSALDVCTAENCQVTLDYVDIEDPNVTPQQQGSWFIQGYGPGLHSPWSTEYFFPIVVVTDPQIITANGTLTETETEGTAIEVNQEATGLSEDSSFSPFSPSGIPSCEETPNCDPYPFPSNSNE